jgi:hypothetical protein
MIPPHTIQISDEEAAILSEALELFVEEFDCDDGLAENRFRQIAKELSSRLPVAIARAA